MCAFLDVCNARCVPFNSGRARLFQSSSLAAALGPQSASLALHRTANRAHNSSVGISICSAVLYLFDSAARIAGSQIIVCRCNLVDLPGLVRRPIILTLPVCLQSQLCKIVFSIALSPASPGLEIQKSLDFQTEFKPTEECTTANLETDSDELLAAH